jgi:hypothetical protein
MDGQLSAEQQRAFEQFLAREPEIAEEMEGLEEIVLERRPVVFEDKAALYRSADEGASGTSRWWAMAASWAFLVVAGSMGLWMSGQWTSTERDSAAWATVEQPPMEVKEVRVAIEQAASPSHKGGQAAHIEEMSALTLDQGWAMAREVPLPELLETEDAGEEEQNIVLAAVEIPGATAVDVLPTAEITPLSTAFAFPTKVRTRTYEEMSAGREPASVFSNDKIAILEPLSKLLTEDQKDWVAQWRPMETIKEEVDRGRWMEAITPEFLQSSK